MVKEMVIKKRIRGSREWHSNRTREHQVKREAKLLQGRMKEIGEPRSEEESEEKEYCQREYAKLFEEIKNKYFRDSN